VIVHVVGVFVLCRIIMCGDGGERWWVARHHALSVCVNEKRFFSLLSKLLASMQILNVTDLGATCCLLEYNDIEGFIASSDYSRKRIRSVKKLMRVGKQEVLQVLRVDEEKGYVDLSKKLLTPKDIENCSERFEKAKTVNGILRRLAEMTNTKLSELCKYRHAVVVVCITHHNYPDDQFGYGLYEGEDGHPYDVLQASLLNPALLTKYNIPVQFHEPLTAVVKHRLSSNPVKVEAEINLTCFGIDGVDALKVTKDMCCCVNMLLSQCLNRLL
jgi:translation initiation factor 2 subunit 1